MSINPVITKMDYNTGVSVASIQSVEKKSKATQIMMNKGTKDNDMYWQKRLPNLHYISYEE